MPVPEYLVNEQPTPASIWRQGYLLQLPSGRAVQVRPISAMGLLSSNLLPDELFRVVEEWISGETKSVLSEDDTINKLGGKAQAVKRSRQFYEAYAYVALLSPRMVENPQADDEIGPLDMDDTDLQFLQQFLGRSGKELASFSAFQQSAGVESLFQVEAFFNPAKSTARRERVASGKKSESVSGEPG